MTDQTDADDDSLKPEVLGIIRHLLTVLGGGLATHGFIGQADIAGFAQIGAGLIFAVGAQLWSIWDKRQTKRALRAARS